MITSHQGGTTETIEEGVRVIRARRLPKLSPLRRYEDHLDSIPAAVWHLLRGRYDLVHAFHLSYAWAAVKARRLGGPPVVYSFHGIPIRRYLVERRYRLEMLQTTLAGTAAVTVLSESAQDVFRRYLLLEPAVLPGGVFASEFTASAARAQAPTLICTASLGDPRKRAGLLFSAFETLRSRRPDARLLVVRTPDPVMSPLEVQAPASVEWIDVDSNGELAQAYTSSWATVLPAVGEAFGLVLVESLAAGTPVVAAGDGGGAEIIDGLAVGRLFEPDDEASLVDAMDDALELAGDPATAEACRARAARYDWDQVIAGYEQLYGSILGGEGR